MVLNSPRTVARSKIHIAVLTLVCTVVALGSGLCITIWAGLVRHYHRIDFFVHPTFRYFWVFLIVLGGLTVFAWRCAFRTWATNRSMRLQYGALAAISCCAATFFLGQFVRLDIPFSHAFDGVRYEIPWIYGPDGYTDGRKSYVRLRAAYPGFSAAPDGADVVSGFDLRVSRQNRPDILCFGDIGCDGRSTSTIPAHEQLLEIVASEVDKVKGKFAYKDAWRKDTDPTRYYFYEQSPNGKPSMYGLCTGFSRYIICDYLYVDSDYFYNIHVRTTDTAYIGAWRGQEELRAIAEGTASLFDSFRQ